ALRSGALSGDQANAVAKGAKADPDALEGLLETARTKSVTQLRDEARQVELRSKDADDLFKRQRRARSLATWVDDLGMVCGRFRLTPEEGTAVRSVIEAQGQRLHRIARRSGITDPYEAHLADALVELVTGKGKGTGSRAEVVVDVSLGALWRGAIGEGEVCEVRGVGPIPVWRAKEILENAKSRRAAPAMCEC
ncbi:MAG TPA: hypothetical protein VI916_02820, partial [Acidimicrobiia bacterium]|nr:hypothetical protein [Acidimicrobiia bacterium]